jgi:GST-like protein
MLDLYAWGTTNGRRALIMIEETGLPYNLHQIDIHKGDQKTPQYQKINPYHKIPALIDSEGPGGRTATVFESVAICFYLAEKTGKFLSAPADRPNLLKWSMFHATNVLCTMSSLGRIDHPSFAANAGRQLETMNRHLTGRDWFVDEYSIADVIPFTRIKGISHEEVRVADYPNVAAWLARVAERPAVRRAMEFKFGQSG